MSKRKTVEKLMEMPAIEALKAEREREKQKPDALNELVGIPEGPYESATFIVKCQVCRHTFGFVNQRQAQLKLADMRRALISYVSRAIHKFMD